MDLPTAHRILQWLDQNPTGAVRWDSKCRSIHFGASDQSEGRTEFPQAILSGSFNPIHEGHREMQRLGRRLLQMDVEYELPVVNADKPALNATQLVRRLATFEDRASVWLTRLPTFEQKSKLFSPAWFVVGADTLVRVADVRFYDHDQERRDAIFANWARQDIRFLVFGRTTQSSFRMLRDLEIPPVLKSLCREVTRDEFEMNISSTEIRRQGQW